MSRTALELIEAALAHGDPDFDPFQAFSDVTGAGLADPYPHWLELQKRGPVVAGTASPPGEERMADLMAGGRPVYSVFGYAAADAVFKDAATFSSRILEETLGLVWGRSIIMMDEPEHTRYRRLIQQAFTRREIDRWEHEIARPILGRFIDAFADRGSVDLVHELLMVFPITVIGEAIGLPAEDIPLFLRLAVEMSIIVAHPERAIAASQSLYDHLRGELDARRRNLGPDLLSQLIEAKLAPAEVEAGEPTRLTDEEIISFVRLLLIAGAETTARSSANLVLLLLRHPDQLAALYPDRSLLSAAVEETLRFEPPLNTSNKLVTADVLLAGVELHKDDVVQVMLGPANRDPRRWDRPNEFDIFREQRPHLAFITGPHMCLGMHLARMEMRVVLEELLDRLPGLRLDPRATDVCVRGMDLRSPATLPVVFDPSKENEPWER